MDAANDLVILKEPTSNFMLSIHPRPLALSIKLVDAIRELEDRWKKPIFLLDQTSAREPMSLREFTDAFYVAVLDRVRELPSNPIILLNSLGGQPSVSFRLANLIRRACGSYSVCILRKAMSGALLFSLGADSLRMGRFAHAGPLDPQLHTIDHEFTASSLTYLKFSGLVEKLFVRVTNSVLKECPDRYSASEVCNILQGAYDGIRVSDALFRRAKAHGFIEAILDYAQRLLSGTYGSRKAKKIAQRLVFDYLDHDHSLTPEELNLIGLEIDVVTLEEQDLLDTIASNLPDAICVGSLTPIHLPYRPGNTSTTGEGT